MISASQNGTGMGHTLHVDGGARGNPGPAAAGVVLSEGERRILASGHLLGELTNNQAEYNALILGLQAAVRCRVKHLAILSDSKLVVRQILGKYRVTSRDLKPLFLEVQGLLLRFDSWQIEHVMREANAAADRLVNAALDQQADVVEVDELGIAAPATGRSKAPTVGEAPAQQGRAAARVTIQRSSTKCPVDCRTGQEFMFTDTVPADLCIYAASGILKAVLRIREEKDAPSTVDVRCSRAGCGARFRVTRLRT